MSIHIKTIINIFGDNLIFFKKNKMLFSFINFVLCNICQNLQPPNFQMVIYFVNYYNLNYDVNNLRATEKKILYFIFNFILVGEKYLVYIWKLKKKHSGALHKDTVYIKFGKPKKYVFVRTEDNIVERNTCYFIKNMKSKK